MLMHILTILSFFTFLHLEVSAQQYDPSVQAAARVLNEKQSGKPLVDFIKQNSVRIELLSQAELERRGHFAGGGINHSPDGTLTILANETLDTYDLAHVIGHETIHLQHELIMTKLMREHPEVNASQENAGTALQTNRGSDLRETHGTDIMKLLATLFFSEYKAHQLNQQLIREGLPSSRFSISESELGEYVDQAYIQKFGLSFQSQIPALNQTSAVTTDTEDFLKRLYSLEEYSNPQLGHRRDSSSERRRYPGTGRGRGFSN